MGGRRNERVAELIRQVLGELLIKRVKDPALRGASLTDVQVSPDLSVARVFFAARDEGEARRIGRGLERATSFLRRELGRRIETKRTPELRFERDLALEQGMRIDAVLREISEEEEEP